MKLAPKKLILLFCVSSLPFASFAQNDFKNNPFVKPSKRVVKEENTCDFSIVEDLVNKRVAELMPAPKVEEKVEVVQSKKSMSNLEIIKASGAKPVVHINGTDIYFDEKNGVFMYDKKIKNKG